MSEPQRGPYRVIAIIKEVVGRVRVMLVNSSNTEIGTVANPICTNITAVSVTIPPSVKITDGTDTADVTAASALKVDGSAVNQPVTGTFWPTTQPVSGTVTVIDARIGSDYDTVDTTVVGGLTTVETYSLLGVPVCTWTRTYNADGNETKRVRT